MYLVVFTARSESRYFFLVSVAASIVPYSETYTLKTHVAWRVSYHPWGLYAYYLLNVEVPLYNGRKKLGNAE